MSATGRIAVITPCYGDGDLVAMAVHSIDEPEPVEVVIVDDGSTDEGTKTVLRGLEAEGYRVVRNPENRGPSAARNTGLSETKAPYVFPLDADDLAVPGALTRMVDRLESSQDAGVCFGDYEEFRIELLARGVPDRLDPYRVAYTNEYPISALYRRQALESAGGWRRVLSDLDARSDWSLWMALAERGSQSVHLGHGSPTYLRRMHEGRLAAAGQRRQRKIYAALRDQHPDLFGDLATHRADSDLGGLRARLYPVVYGGRPRSRAESLPKALLDRAGVWTLTGDVDDDTRRQVATAFAAAERRTPATPEVGEYRIAVVIPCHGDADFVADAVHSIDEPEPVEIVVVDDGSTDEGTKAALRELEAEGYRVVRHPENRGVSAARNTGLSETRAPYVFPLDADDIAVPHALSRMANRLDGAPTAAVCFGEYIEFRVQSVVRGVPEWLDPYRIAYTNEYPPSAVFRRVVLEETGGWRDIGDVPEDWELWLTLAERGVKAIHLGMGEPTYRRRVHSRRPSAGVGGANRDVHAIIRAAHPELFDRLWDHRMGTDMAWLRRELYPVAYGRRRLFGAEAALKPLLDRWGIRTLRR